MNSIAITEHPVVCLFYHHNYSYCSHELTFSDFFKTYFCWGSSHFSLLYFFIVNGLGFLICTMCTLVHQVHHPFLRRLDIQSTTLLSSAVHFFNFTFLFTSHFTSHYILYFIQFHIKFHFSFVKIQGTDAV